ncbi:uncharacterized protein LACBIDRAFT_321645 [Laccaria bicolor S238N-H82]|uniref:Predicted protein n=1 Tax=Laccaria bicolor (strain S238N-H82 / ATCC MYA-4686) TaxID=486041 RepID=B0CTN2_LACBS|nr:uncharacterized protein LACBIDRAFT_321645 [Laccaria bicolor S238N-H82]EDR14523.1 predicted protein [Laccaria bicolor S238N-H82]|eukprot:XP_001875082.1 predicted protein [Laccaria bicolor S238N-H82]
MFSKHVLAFFLVPSLLDLSLWHWYIFSAQTARIVTNCHEQPRVVASHNHAAGNCAFSFRRLSVAVYGSPVLNPLGMKAILVVIMTGGFLPVSGFLRALFPSCASAIQTIAFNAKSDAKVSRPTVFRNLQARRTFPKPSSPPCKEGTWGTRPIGKDIQLGRANKTGVLHCNGQD